MSILNNLWPLGAQPANFYPSKLTSLFFQSYIPLLFSSIASAGSWITEYSLWDDAAISYQFLSSFFWFLFLCSWSSLLLAHLLFFSHCAFVALVPLFPPVMTGVALAVEIKVIKDLPWPPPVGQLNSTPTVVEELESPTQTAQAPPGQTCCDQHHHGGCCAHIFLYHSHPPSLSAHYSIMHLPRACTTTALCLIIPVADTPHISASVCVCVCVINEDLPPKNAVSHKSTA